jgi:protein-L-isoaspartate(D-aspartate) O-methyltransferase
MKFNPLFLKIPFIFLLVSTFYCSNSQEQSLNFTQKRMEMVKWQIEARGIRDQAVLAAMRKVERHRFVPQDYELDAYADYPLPIGEGQTISQPYIVALMTEIATLKKSDKVLEVGTGSGYQAAVLAEICDSVYSIEINENLAKSAQKTLADLGYTNISISIGDGYQGWSKHCPYDAILVTCAPTSVPQPLIDQLRDGGRLVIPVGPASNQQLVLYQKQQHKINRKISIPVRFVPMIDKKGRNY